MRITKLDGLKVFCFWKGVKCSSICTIEIVFK